MRAFVTGSTGFLGGALVRQLLDAGDEVVALVRSTKRAQHLAEYASKAPGRIEFAEGDITDKESMRAPMAGAEGVYHLAAWYKLGQSAAQTKLGEEINVGGTRHVCELMAEYKIPKGVYTSTLAVNSDTQGQVRDESYHFDGVHMTAYDRSKAEAHAIALQAMAEGLPLVIAMPGVIYGPGDTSMIGDMIRRYLRGKLPMLPAKPEYSWAHVDDVATAHRLCMDKGKAGEKYIVCGERYGVVDAYKLMESICGVPAPKRALGPGMLRFIAGFMQAFQWMRLPPDMHPETLRVSAATTYLGDNSKAKRELGYAPRSLREGMEQTLRAEMEALGMEFPS